MNTLDVVANHREILEKDLQQFAELYTGEQHGLISALADKIYHMCIYIGSPSSVKPMLRSIVNGKLKTWSDTWDTRGKQLTGMCKHEVKRKYEGVEYKRVINEEGETRYKEMYVNPKIVKGNFRWNHGTGYIADYQTRDYIKAYFLDDKVEELKKICGEQGKDGIRFKVRSAMPVKHDEHTYTIEIVTGTGAEYRFHFYPNGDRVTCNWGEHKANGAERRFVKSLINDKFNKSFNIY